MIILLNKFLFQDNNDIKTFKGMSDKSISFTGNNSGAIIQSPNNILNIIGDFTSQFKVKIRDLSNSFIFLCTGNGGESESANVLYQISATPNGEIVYKCEYNYGSDVTVTTDSVYLSLNTWIDIAVTRDATNNYVRFYVNGVFKEQKTFSHLPTGGTNSKFTIGSWINTSLFLDGQMDDIKIWNRKLTDAEIANLYDHKVDINSDGLVGYWPIEENEGNIIHDKTQYGDNMTISNGSFVDDIDSSLNTWNTIGSAPATEDMFTSNGMNSLINIDNDAIQQLSSDKPEVLMYVPNNATTTTTTSS